MNQKLLSAWSRAKRRAVLTDHPQQVKCGITAHFNVRGERRRDIPEFKLALLIPSWKKMEDWWKVLEWATQQWVEGKVTVGLSGVKFECTRCGRKRNG